MRYFSTNTIAFNVLLGLEFPCAATGPLWIVSFARDTLVNCICTWNINQLDSYYIYIPHIVVKRYTYIIFKVFRWKYSTYLKQKNMRTLSVNLKIIKQYYRFKVRNFYDKNFTFFFFKSSAIFWGWIRSTCFCGRRTPDSWDFPRKGSETEVIQRSAVRRNFVKWQWINILTSFSASTRRLITICWTFLASNVSLPADCIPIISSLSPTLLKQNIEPYTAAGSYFQILYTVEFQFRSRSPPHFLFLKNVIINLQNLQYRRQPISLFMIFFPSERKFFDYGE